MGEPTVAAIATPTGLGGIGVIRLSGPEAFAIADRVFESVSGVKLCDTPGYRAHYGRLVTEGKTLDDAVALVFRAPHSYTGEDVVEVSVHGGRFVTKAALRSLLDAGAKPAGPGEFTKRAFLNGKMDLTEAEAVMGIIDADNAGALRASRAAADGAVTKRLTAIKEKLLLAAATITAFTDFPDEEPSFSGIDKLPDMLDQTANALAELIRHYDAGKVWREGVRTAIIGSANVGKSTLMNLISGHDRSIVTDVAGTTRDVIEETVMLGDLRLNLADTAGLRDTEDAVEKIGVDRSRQAMETADLILFVLDASRPMTEEETELLQQTAQKPSIVILNKTDLTDTVPVPEVGDRPLVLTAAKEGQGLAELEEAVRTVCGAGDLREDTVLLSCERQRACAVRALDELTAARKTLQDGYTVDAVGTCLDTALGAVMELTGESVTTEVAEEVFRRFCVGK